jgi:hypothetical protein
MEINKEINMITDLEGEGQFEGYWWLPDNPEEKLPGIAKYDGKYHVILKLYGKFSLKINKIQVILGQLRFNNKISLLKCSGKLSNEIQIQDDVMVYSIFRCSEFIEGYHVKSLSELIINRVDFSFTNLTHWLTSRLNDEETGIESDYLDKTSDYLLNDELTLKDGLKIEFKSHLFAQSVNLIRKNIEVKSYISLYHKDGKSLEYFKKVISKFQSLLSFAMKGQAYPKKIKIFPMDGMFFKHEFILNEEIKIKYVYPLRGDYHECSETLPQNMLFNYSLIKDNLIEILNKWIFDSKEYGLAFELYFSILFNKKMYLEHTFLSYIQAIEGILRIMQGNPTIVDEEIFKQKIYKPFKYNLTKDIDELSRSKLLCGFKRLNDFSLRQRLDAFIKEFSQEFKNKLFFNKINESEFSKDIVKLRNYFSHLFVDAPECYSNLELFNTYIHRLKIILEILLFRIIGLEQNKIEDIIPKNFRG